MAQPKKVLQEAAQERQEQYNRLSLHEKIRRAKERGGIHTKEYKRLVAELEKVQKKSSAKKQGNEVA